MPYRKVFVSGGTGYMGRALVDLLVTRGHEVRVLARQGSERKVAAAVQVVAHPAPWKERGFRAIDLASLRASAKAAKSARLAHFVYVSVAQPAPIMKAYIRVRRECEEILKDNGLTATVLRPWYVLGPGHRWPVALKPVYALLESLRTTRDAARRLGLVTLEEMVGALAWSVEHPAGQTRTLDVPAIRSTHGELAGGRAYGIGCLAR